MTPNRLAGVEEDDGLSVQRLSDVLGRQDLILCQCQAAGARIASIEEGMAGVVDEIVLPAGEGAQNGFARGAPSADDAHRVTAHLPLDQIGQGLDFLGRAVQVAGRVGDEKSFPRPWLLTQRPAVYRGRCDHPPGHRVRQGQEAIAIVEQLPGQVAIVGGDEKRGLQPAQRLPHPQRQRPVHLPPQALERIGCGRGWMRSRQRLMAGVEVLQQRGRLVDGFGQLLPEVPGQGVSWNRGLRSLWAFQADQIMALKADDGQGGDGLHGYLRGQASPRDPSIERGNSHVWSA